MSDDSRDPDAIDDRVTAAIKFYDLCVEAYAPQVALELEDLNFVDDPKGQWSKEDRDARAAGTIAGIPVPARPCMTIDLLDQPIQQTVNQGRAARLSVQFSPKGGQANQDTAEMLQGLYRNIEVESNAQSPRMWAFERAAKCGRGYYRILTEYANDGDDDQDIVIARILNQGTVYIDPFYQATDASDMRGAIIVDDVPFDRYKSEYPDSTVAAWTPSEFTSVGDEQAPWMGGDEKGRTVRVAEHFYVEGTGASRKVYWCKVNAFEVLDERKLQGRYIPIVQVIGKETNVNGVRRFSGIVRKAKEPQRVFNYMRTKEVEAVALAPLSPFVAAEGQFEGYEQQMLMANTRAFPFLYYKPKTIGQNLAPPPVRSVVEPAIQAISMSASQARDDVHATTGVYQPSLGEMSHSGQSGRAIKALQGQSEQTTSNYLDSLANVSMVYEAKVILDLMPHVYDKPGRVVRILTGDDDQAKSVMLNAPFVPGPNGQPIPAPDGVPNAKMFTLSPDDRYGVTVTVGQSFTNRREQASAMMGQLAEAVPQLVPLYADIWVRNQGIPGGDEIADRFHDMLPPQILQKEQGQQGDPAQMAQQLQQMQMQLQQLKPLADDNQAKLQLKQMELDVKREELAVKAQEIQANTQLKAATLESQQQIAALKASTEQSIAVMQAQLDAAKLAQTAQQAHDDRRHEAGMHAVDLQHDRESAYSAATHDREMADHEVANRPEPREA